MPGKRKNLENNDLKYANWLVQMVLMMEPKNLALVLGRGTGKTTDILAQRFQAVSYEMPGCYIALSSDTYMNARKNVIPSLIEGWSRNGWLDEYHFVVNTRPPKTWIKKCYKPPIAFKDSLTIFNGTHCKIISQDRPSTGAGDSYQHIFGDEVKYQEERKINKLNPAVRGGEVKFRKSPYYGGRTFTTDMPNINHGEHDWILNFEKNVDPEKLELLLKCAFVVNDLRLEHGRAINYGDEKGIRNAKRNLDKWMVKFNALRKDSTFFYIASSFANVDVLGLQFFKDILATMNFGEVRTAIFSFQTKLEKGLSFYPNLQPDNFYKDSWNYDRIDQIDYREKIEELSLDLKNINHHQSIEAGMDTGNMCSLVTGQTQGSNLRIIKEFYTLPPEFLPQLGKQFREFYQYHKKKHLVLYYDRAANKYKSVGEDHASKFKKSVEYDENGNSTGWTVTLMSENQANILQQTEYEMMLEFMSGKNKDLPTLLIDQNLCPCYKSSMELSEKIIRSDKEGTKTIHKDKSSEKLPTHRLPMFSTNMSDAGKYFICRPEHIKVLSGKSSYYSTYIPSA